MASSSYFKSDYHAWKMSLDLTLEEHDAMDYVQGNITEPPSNALVATKTKYKKGEVKAKKIIRDYIHKHLVAYISDLGTSKEMYDKLVCMFKTSNANEVLFLKNKLKDIKKGRGEDNQSYFMRITKIKIIFYQLEKLLLIGSSLSLPLEVSLMNGMCSTLLSSTMIGFQVLMNC